MKFLSDIQKKSKETRKMYAFWSSAVITSLITLLWVTSLPEKMGDKIEEGQIEEVSGNFKKVFKDMTATVADAFKKTSDEIKAIDEQTASTSVLFDTDNRDFDSWLQESGGTNTSTASSSVVASSTASTSQSTTEAQSKIKPESGPRVILIGTTTSNSTTTNQ